MYSCDCTTGKRLGGIKRALPVVNFKNDQKIIEKQPLQKRRLTIEEQDAKRLKGECFSCSAKYVKGHICQTQKLQMAIIEEVCILFINFPDCLSIHAKNLIISSIC